MAAFTVISHQELTGNASSVTFGSISGSYDHLCIKISARSDDVQYYDHLGIQFNGDTGTNYSDTYIYCGTAAPGSSRSTTYNHISHLYGVTAASNLADTFGTMTVWVPHYANSTNFKQVAARCGSPSASTTQTLLLAAGLWESTDAIDEVELTTYSGNFVQYSTFTLYGVTGA